MSIKSEKGCLERPIQFLFPPQPSLNDSISVDATKKKIEDIPNDDDIRSKTVRLKRKFFIVSSKENILTISLVKMNDLVVIEPDGEYETFDISISDRRVQCEERA